MSDNEQSTIYVVWSDADLVHGIYKNKNDALSEYKQILSEQTDEVNETNCVVRWIKLDDIRETSRINASSDPGIIKIKYKNPNQKDMYLSTVRESGGGGSYHHINYCKLYFTHQGAINNALEHFDQEHARPELSDDENCEYCVGNKNKTKKSKDSIPLCKQKFISELKNDMCAEIDYLVGPDSIDVSITKIKIL